MVDGGKTQEKRKKDGVRLSVRSIFGRDILIEAHNGVTFFLREYFSFFFNEALFSRVLFLFSKFQSHFP